MTDLFSTGKGGKLFVNILLYFFLPAVIISLIFARVTAGVAAHDPMQFNAEGSFVRNLVLNLAMLIPSSAIFIKAAQWAINLKHDTSQIWFETEFFEGFGIILLQLFLSLITFGIYAPVAFAKIYMFVLSKTIINDEETMKRKQLLAEFDFGKLFLVVWGQILLTIVSLGVYLPWAYCRIVSYYAQNTYLNDQSEE